MPATCTRESVCKSSHKLYDACYDGIATLAKILLAGKVPTEEQPTIVGATTAPYDYFSYIPGYGIVHRIARSFFFSNSVFGLR